MSAALTDVFHKPRLRGWLHLLTVPVAVVGAMILWDAADHSAGGRASVAVFGLCTVGLYAVSSVYHVGDWSARMRQVLSRCDGVMIQFMIAGTFTPIAYHALSGSWRLWSLVGAWSIALVGAVIAASALPTPRWLGTAGYIAAGWITVVPFTRIIGALPWEGTGLIVLGGVLYTVGAVVFALRRPDPFPRWFGYHEIFHIFVVAASTAHYVAVWQYVLP